jgi:hypothetical protein
MEQDEAWSTGRLYFDMGAYLEWKQGQLTQKRKDLTSLENVQLSIGIEHNIYVKITSQIAR